jgi:hypothetical protein
MTDKELLELAAKAAGIKWQSYHMSRGLCLADPKGGMVITQMWNPLTDDGDALRLAVKLNIVIWECDQYDRAMAEVRYGEARGEYWELVGKDKYSSTRRAITRAAAEIGKAMP